MEPALAAIWLSVVLGAALGLGQRWAPRATDPIRTFAVVAAALAVSLGLLPHALEQEGLQGLLGVALGSTAIPALERLGRAWFRHADPRTMRLELGYSGLVLHRFGDGVAMSVDGHGYAVIWALGAHEVPIVALVTLAFARRSSAAALARATILGASSSLGYWLVRATSAATWHELHGWADAIAAGVLIHLVAHEGLGAGLPAPEGWSVRRRILDVSAALLALGLIAGADLDREEGAHVLLARLLNLALQVAPLSCLGLLVTAALRTGGALAPRGSRWNAWFGSGPASAREVASRTVAGPPLNPPALGASLALLGVPFALLQAGSAVLLGALAHAAAGGPAAHSRGSPPRDIGVSFQLRAWTRRFWTELECAAAQVAGGMAFGLLAATYAEAFVPAGSLGHQGSLWQLCWALPIGALSYLCTPAAVPLAAALMTQGLGAGVALAGLLLGPAGKLVALLPSPTSGGPSAGMRALAASSGGALTIAALLQVSSGLRVSPFTSVLGGTPAPWVVLVGFGALVARSIWRTGVRGWLYASLSAGMTPEGARPSHPHVCAGGATPL